eukprot:334334_1
MHAKPQISNDDNKNQQTKSENEILRLKSMNLLRNQNCQFLTFMSNIVKSDVKEKLWKQCTMPNQGEHISQPQLIHFFRLMLQAFKTSTDIQIGDSYFQHLVEYLMTYYSKQLNVNDFIDKLADNSRQYLQFQLCVDIISKFKYDYYKQLYNRSDDEIKKDYIINTSLQLDILKNEQLKQKCMDFLTAKNSKFVGFVKNILHPKTIIGASIWKKFDPQNWKGITQTSLQKLWCLLLKLWYINIPHLQNAQFIAELKYKHLLVWMVKMYGERQDNGLMTFTIPSKSKFESLMKYIMTYIECKGEIKFILKNKVHRKFITPPDKDKFESIISTKQTTIMSSSGRFRRIINVMPVIIECKYLDKYFYLFNEGDNSQITDNEFDYQRFEYCTEMVKLPKCKFAIRSNIPNEIGNIIRNKMKYLEVNPLFTDYRYPLRNNEIIKRILILREKKKESNGKGIGFFRNDLDDEMKDFNNNRNENELTKQKLDKCIRYGSNSDEFMKYLYSEHTSVDLTNWLKLTNMVENDELEFKKWRIRIQDIIDPSMNCQQNNNLFIPSLFYIDDNYKTKIISDINNLSRVLYSDLYAIIEKIFSFMAPMFEYVLFDDNGYSLRNETLKVVVKSQIYELFPNETYNGNKHKEGYDLEKICAVGIYYFDKDECIKNDI